MECLTETSSHLYLLGAEKELPHCVLHTSSRKCVTEVGNVHGIS